LLNLLCQVQRVYYGLELVPVIKTYKGNPIALSEFRNTLWLSFKPIPRITASINNRFFIFKTPVSELMLPQELPNLFDWIEPA
jgi:hypothetical protein